MAFLILDMSAHQTPQGSGSPNANFNNFNFAALKAAGVKGVIFRVIGFRSGSVMIDASFESGYTKAKAAGLYVGAYHFLSQNFKTRQNGVNDANLLLQHIRGKKLDLGVWADYEPDDNNRLTRNNKSGVTAALQGWCDTIEDAGFYAGIYANVSDFKSQMNMKNLTQYAFWVARYPNNSTADNSLKADSKYSPKHDTTTKHANQYFRSNCQIWQFSSHYKISSAYNGSLDADWCYTNIPNAVKNMTTGKKTSGGTPAAAVTNFTIRKSAPPHNKYYNSPDNPFVGREINGFSSGGNCTWYAWGRFMEIQGTTAKEYWPYNPKISSGRHAQNWAKGVNKSVFNPARAWGTTPELGAVAVYKGGKYGHVAIVERINSNGSVFVSESGQSFKNSEGNGGCGFHTFTTKTNGDYSSGLKLLGYIYNPAIHNQGSGSGRTSVSGNTRTSGSTVEKKKYLTWITEDANASPELCLGSEAMRNNAILVYLFFKERGFSQKSIAAMCGNMMVESHINPATYQGWASSGDRNDTSLGYGLIQWTPPKKILDWLDANDYSPIDGDAQLLWIHSLATNTMGEWFQNTDPDRGTYYEAFIEFMIDGTHDLEWLTKCFQYSLLRGGYGSETERVNAAKSYYEFFTGNDILGTYGHFPGDNDDYSLTDVEIPESPDDYVPYKKPNNKHMLIARRPFVY